MLTIEGLYASYGMAPALFGVDLCIEPGRIAALMGRNGMGKTTLLRAVMGRLRITGGRIAMAGRDITGWPSHRIARAGIGYVPQGREIFSDLTVEENLLLGVLGHPGLDTAIPARLVELFPVFSRLRMMRTWAGIVDVSPDASPIIGPLPVRGLYLNGGWGTGGFKATPGSGHVFAWTIANDRAHPLAAPFGLERFISGALIDEHGAAAVAH